MHADTQSGDQEDVGNETHKTNSMQLGLTLSSGAFYIW